MTYDNYFKFRQITPEDYSNHALPAYLSNLFDPSQTLRILDFGCGFGQTLDALRRVGHAAVEGVDIEPSAIEHCRKLGFICHDGNKEANFFESNEGIYDYVIMGHVLEHLPKSEMIPHLEKIRSLLKSEGKLILSVPNAQSNTAAYWRYEDFTHNYLFTSGSIYYVLASAGFQNITYLDIDCTEGLAGLKKLTRKFFLFLYRIKYVFWNKITASAVHAPSPMIFSYEIKVMAGK